VFDVVQDIANLLNLRRMCLPEELCHADKSS
jgi:hypothetical protein